MTLWLSIKCDWKDSVFSQNTSKEGKKKKKKKLINWDNKDLCSSSEVVKINTVLLNRMELWQLKWIGNIPQVISVAVGNCFYIWTGRRGGGRKLLTENRHRLSTFIITPTFDLLYPFLISKTQFLILSGELVLGLGLVF